MSEPDSVSKPSVSRPGVPVMISRGEYWRRKWKRKVLIACAVLMAVGITASIGGGRLIHFAKQWRARKLVDFARLQKTAGNLPEAKSYLLQAFTLARDDSEVLRAMARDYATTPQERLQFLNLLASSGDATREDRLEFCRAALDFRLGNFASVEFERMINDPASKDDPEIAELCARYLTQQGAGKKALAWTSPAPVHGEEAAKGGPQSPVITSNSKMSLIRAKLLLDSLPIDKDALTKSVDEVAQLLTAVIETGTGDLARESTLLLGRLYVTLPEARNVIGIEHARSLVDKLHSFSDEPTLEAGLVRADLMITLDPPQKEAVLEELGTAVKVADVPARQSLARWLNARGEFDRARKLAELSPAQLKDRDWFLIRLDAMAAKHLWSDIESDLLNPDGVPIEAVLGRLFLWRCAKELRRPEAEVAQRRSELIDVCTDKTAREALFAADYLSKLGDMDAACIVYQKYLDNEAFASSAYLGWVRCLGSDPKRTEALRLALERMVEKFPRVAEARNDLAYLNLLDGRKLNESIQVATSLVAESPQALGYRTTMALAELVRGNPKAAESMYRGLDIDWKKVSAGWVAVRAAVMAANGKMVEAKALLVSVKPGELREGERKLLNRYAGTDEPLIE